MNTNNSDDDSIPNWPTFDCNEENSPSNRLYITKTSENAKPGIQPKEQNQDLMMLKFDWYFSTREGELSSEEFSIPNSGKLFTFRSRSAPWMEHGKEIQVFLVNVDDSPQNVSVEYTVKLRLPNWENVKELRGSQEFTYAVKCLDLFCINGKSVDVWPADSATVLTADTDLIPRVYSIKGTLKVMKDRVQNWKLISGPSKKVECLQLKLNEDDN